MPPVQDLTGLRFGRLTVIGRQGSAPGGAALWECRCDCGKTATVRAGNLKSGHATRCGRSCGMDLREGERFGSLTVVGPTGRKNANGSDLWSLRCDCGGVCDESAAVLRSGRRTSCGCHAARSERAAEANGLYDGTRLSMLKAKVPSTSTTGIKGVSRDKRNGKYVARIKLRGRSRYLGTYETLQEAAEARREAEKALFDPVLEEHGWELTDDDH